jgi:hypothetical protein
MQKNQIWTPEMQEILENNPDLKPIQLAIQFGCSIDLVYQKMRAIKDAKGEPKKEYNINKVEPLKPKLVREKGKYSNGITGSRLIANILCNDSSYLQENYLNRASNVTIRYSY